MSWTLLPSSSCLLSLLVSTSLSMLIPESFDSVQTYLESFVFPLLEEIQAELCSAVEAASSSPFAEVLSLKKKQHMMPYYSMMSRLVRGETDRVTQARSHTDLFQVTYYCLQKLSLNLLQTCNGQEGHGL